ncbi:carbon-nitrogen hydrolase [Sulfurihydrogenibium azorense]|uniref:N-carbamoylputrescine amidase n=1 Tax=Sulfurihydrogenibium azorense (strain DSM 15241 / OCM 825 / Az-Fu1) TaxID=204536 RepID=C1DWQ9_SULAA|nr:carbon-nitrogen hydrolase [Sulfurihydrogenibium azorense]ACN99653.1 N-carbamoylputrescine amidase [Sulfurihydrogenibium azorense Az-Fu1]MDM7273229.1 carbon-nitrogen hydrolase [Sulfurihydrogenibium azorense]
MDKVNVGLIQMRCSDDLNENFEKTVEKIKSLAKSGANIVSTQELFKSKYFCQVEDWEYFKLAEVVNEDSPTIKTLQKVAKDNNVVIVASLFEKRTDGIYHNTAVVIDADGKYLGKYRKMHIPDDPHFYEKFYFTPGDLGYKTFKTKYADIGVLICWDQWYPEAARLTALSGAKIIFYPTAIGWLPSEKEQFGKQQYNAWETVQRGHAVANGCYVVAVNRVGFEASPDGNEGIEFWGQSFVSDPYGELLLKASIDKEEELICEIDLSIIDSVRTTWPFFRDRRIDSYQDITKRFID